jgi:hypothetical protein
VAIILIIYFGVVLNVTNGKLFNFVGRFKLKLVLKIILIGNLFVLNQAFAVKEPVTKKVINAVYYYKNIFGHLHQNASRYSRSLTNIACGHPIRIFEKHSELLPEIVVGKQRWVLSKIGPYEGYLREDFIHTKRPFCFQDKYPKFFSELKLDLTDKHYWGRLYDMLLQGKSNIK